MSFTGKYCCEVPINKVWWQQVESLSFFPLHHSYCKYISLQNWQSTQYLSSKATCCYRFACLIKVASWLGFSTFLILTEMFHKNVGQSYEIFTTFSTSRNPTMSLASRMSKSNWCVLHLMFCSPHPDVFLISEHIRRPPWQFILALRTRIKLGWFVLGNHDLREVYIRGENKAEKSSFGPSISSELT